jgi:hypothetical protein
LERKGSMRTIRLLLALILPVLLTLFLIACDAAEAPSPTATPATPTPPSTPSGEAAITVDSPAEGETVTVPVKVAGTASVFEATLSVAVRDSEGRVLCEVVTMASEGAPGRGDYEVTMGFPPPEEETSAEVVAYTRSPKDGSIQDTVTVPITLSPETPPVALMSPVCAQEVSSPVLVEGRAGVGEEIVVTVGGLFGGELGRTTLQADAQGDFSGEVEFPVEQAQAGVIAASIAGDEETLFSVPVILIP